MDQGWKRDIIFFKKSLISSQARKNKGLNYIAVQFFEK